MDRVRAYLPVLKKHHFWILTAVVVVAAAFAWWKGTAGLKEEFETARGALQNRFTTVEGISRRPNHPNQSFITEVGQQHNTLKEEVFRAWQILYNKQQQILVWPEWCADVATLASDEEIPLRHLDSFMNYFEKEFPKLFDTVQPLKAAEEIEGKGAAEARQGLVEWEQSQRDEIKDGATWTERPSSKAVRFAQEDYWVYTALLTIIDRANKKAGATANYNAAVKKINNLQIGQEAKRPSTTLQFTGDADGPQQQAAAQTQNADANDNDATLEQNRYVDDQGNPLRSASAGPFAEVKLMPVLIEVVMDQRKIPLLLAECANSELPVEIRQVRINPGSAGGGGGRRRRGGGGGPPRGFGTILPSPAAKPTHQLVAYNFQRGVGGAAQAVKSDFDATVEIWGLIYIFERPDATKLGIDETQLAEFESTDADSQIGPAEGEGEVAGNDDAADAVSNPAAPANGGSEPGDGSTN